MSAHGRRQWRAATSVRAGVLAILARSLALVLMAALTACAAYAPPRPWEKGELARAPMQLDPDPLAARVQQHIYTSKEAAGGGTGVGGGGCGCN